MEVFGAPLQIWALVTAAMLVATWVQVLTGFAFSLLFLGLIGTFDWVPLNEATNAISIITLVQARAYFRAHPLQPQWRTIMPAIGPSIIGVMVGAAVLIWLSAQALHALKFVLGAIIVLTALSMLARPVPWPQLSSPVAYRFTGLLSGLMGGMFSTSGPPLVYLLYRQPLEPQVIRQCLLLMFTIGQLVRLVFITAAGQFTWRSLLYIGLSLPVVALVHFLHRHFPLHLSQRTAARCAAALLLLTGAALLAGTIRAAPDSLTSHSTTIPSLSI